MDGVGLRKDIQAEGPAHAQQQTVEGHSMLDAAKAQGGEGRAVGTGVIPLGEQAPTLAALQTNSPRTVAGSQSTLSVALPIAPGGP